MVEQLEENLTGVTCLFCGLPTPLAVSTNQGTSAGVIANSSPRLFIVRCSECGKEAPYFAHEVVVFKGTSHAMHLAV